MLRKGLASMEYGLSRIPQGYKITCRDVTRSSEPNIIYDTGLNRPHTASGGLACVQTRQGDQIDANRR
jgi:hypothetical protein